MWECPTSAIPSYIWSVIDLFFLCYIRTPGLNGTVLQRQSFPEDKPPLEQDNWLMSAFQVLEGAFYKLEKDLQQERQVQSRVAKGKENARKQIGR
jgi:hypothetical protein